MEHVWAETFSRRDLLRATLAGGVLLAAGCGGKEAVVPAQPKRGGTLRYGASDGSIQDTLDVHQTAGTVVDNARAIQLFDRLMEWDHSYRVQLGLAEEFAPSADVLTWTLRLRDGITFHNGKPLTADDVIYSLRRIVDPEAPGQGAVIIPSVDPNGLTKLDTRTVRLRLKYPDATLPDGLARPVNGIVPVDFDPKAPVGTGAFKFESFRPGQQSVFVRNEDYWRQGEPHLDEIVIIDFPDLTARVNALLSGQIDAMDRLPFEQVGLIRSEPRLRVVISRTGAFDPVTLRADRPPFNDVRVRQAMRLIVDRPQMLKQVFAGFGRLGNDLPFIQDPCYDSTLPQRAQDLAQARSLLKSAGQEGLRVTFDTAPALSGLVEAAQVFAEQAKGAGVTIAVNNVTDVGQFYEKFYGQSLFSQDYYFTNPWFTGVGYGLLPDAPFNTTHWSDEKFTSLVEQARRQQDENKRCEILHEAQEILYDSGPWIIWGFRDLVDAYSAKFTGFVPDAAGAGLNYFAFREVSLA